MNFIDDAYIDEYYRLLVKYSDNSQIDTDKDRVGDYINHGQLLAVPLIKSGELPESNLETIEDILAFCNDPSKEWGIESGKADGALYVVTTQHVSPLNEKSYFIRWNPDTQLWENVAQITSNGDGIPVQLPLNGNSNMSFDTYVLATGAIKMLEMQQTDTAVKASPWS